MDWSVNAECRINKKYVVIVLAVGLLLTVGCVVSKLRGPQEADEGWQQKSNQFGGSDQVDLTGNWTAHAAFINEELEIKQSGNTIEGTMVGENETFSWSDPEQKNHIAGTIYGDQIEFTRTYVFPGTVYEGWTQQYSGVVSGTPGSLLSIQGTFTTPGYPGQDTWTAQQVDFGSKNGGGGLPDLPDHLHRVDEAGSRWGNVP